MANENPITGPYASPAKTYHSSPAQYSRVIQVSGSINNPLTLTGSYANNVGFIIIQPGSVAMKFAGSNQTFNSGQFHEVGAAHTIYPISLTYVSASNTGSILVLYND
jgi:hypothetical protein